MRAEELRAIAETMRGDSEERAKLRALAVDLDRMADRLERNQRLAAQDEGDPL